MGAFRRAGLTSSSSPAPKASETSRGGLGAGLGAGAAATRGWAAGSATGSNAGCGAGCGAGSAEALAAGLARLLALSLGSAFAGAASAFGGALAAALDAALEEALAGAFTDAFTDALGAALTSPLADASGAAFVRRVRVLPAVRERRGVDSDSSEAMKTLEYAKKTAAAGRVSPNTAVRGWAGGARAQVLPPRGRPRSPAPGADRASGGRNLPYCRARWNQKNWKNRPVKTGLRRSTGVSDPGSRRESGRGERI